MSSKFFIFAVMTIQHAKEAAHQWVLEEAMRTPGFRGAYFAGSVNLLPEDATLPASSDVDVSVVVSGPGVPDRLGIIMYGGVLLDVSYVPMERLKSPEVVLGDYHLASTFSTPNIILDPTGRLAALQMAVARQYAQRRWVYERCAQARDKVLWYLEQLDARAPLHDNVLICLFAAGVTTHVLLVAGLKSPTVKRRYVTVRELLAEHGRLDFDETLLELLGSAQMSRAQVEQHLSALEETFDAAAAVAETPFFFTSEISAIARPLAIGSVRDMVAQGYHREAVFWIAVTYSRCGKVLHHEAPAHIQERSLPGYASLLAGLGIASFGDLENRAKQIKALLPSVWEVAEGIIALRG